MEQCSSRKLRLERRWHREEGDAGTGCLCQGLRTLTPWWEELSPSEQLLPTADTEGGAGWGFLPGTLFLKRQYGIWLSRVWYLGHCSSFPLEKCSQITPSRKAERIHPSFDRRGQDGEGLSGRTGPGALSYTCPNSQGPVFSWLHPGQTLFPPLRRGGMGQFPEAYERAILALSLQPLSSLWPQ